MPGDPARVVREVAGPVTPDLRRQVVLLRERGFRTVLGPGSLDQGLLDSAWGVRLSAQQLLADGGAPVLDLLTGHDLVLLADGVHTRDEAAAAAAAGCTLAQGSLWLEPELIRAATLKTGAAAGFRLAGLLFAGRDR